MSKQHVLETLIRTTTAASNVLCLRTLNAFQLEKTGEPVIGCRVTATLPVSTWTVLGLIAQQANEDRERYVRSCNTMSSICAGVHHQMRGLPDMLIRMLRVEDTLGLQAVESWFDELATLEDVGEDRLQSTLADETLETRAGYLRPPSYDADHWSLCELATDDGRAFLLPTAFLSVRPQEDNAGEQVVLHHPQVNQSNLQCTFEYILTVASDVYRQRDPNGATAFGALECIDRSPKNGFLRAGDIISFDTAKRDVQARAVQVALGVTVDMVKASAKVMHDDFKGLMALDSALEFFESDAWNRAVEQSVTPDGSTERTYEVIHQMNKDEAQTIRDRYDDSADMSDGDRMALARDLSVRCVETQEVMNIPSGVAISDLCRVNGKPLHEICDERRAEL